jgi:hypothetical protein
MSLLQDVPRAVSVKPIFIWSILTTFVSVIALIASQTDGWIAAVGVGVIIFLGAFTAGSLLGFLFGIPRVLTREQPAAITEADGSAQARQMLKSNTNLERISDWLATLLVGVGLSQLHNINEALVAFRNYIAATATVFPGPNGGRHAGILPAVAPPFLIAGAIVGFLLMYLYTRTSLVLVLNAVETDLLSGSTQKRLKEAASQFADETDSFVAKQVSTTSKVSVDDALSLMYNMLYKPLHYDRVIKIARDVFETSASERPEYWFYLACAFGQRLNNRSPEDEVAAKADRRNALDAARRAVQIDPLFKARLKYVADPKGPEKDLSALWPDPEFQQIIA